MIMGIPDLFSQLPPERVPEALNLAIRELTATHEAAVAQVIGMAEAATGEQLRQTGSRSVLDLSVSDFEAVLRRAEHLRLAVEIMTTWTLRGDRPTTTAGKLIKTLPPEVSETIIEQLRAAGALA
ncbi:hypothetical protein ACIPX0_12330 [Streptomyces sp. NPDC090075]|uniref:hypothetical protein n=1 Tax=Streptomyces sp. NPDC090075 TaxID=3365937 RepID=UPI003813B209